MNELARLRRERPRSRLARFTVIALVALVAFAWLGRDRAGKRHFDAGAMFTERSRNNLERFTRELRPLPLQDTEWDTGVAVAWARETLAAHGTEAILTTLAMSIAAIVLAAAAAALLSMPAARNVATAEPFLPASSPPGRAARLLWRAVLTLTRLLLIFLRAIPEYVWAFIFLGLLGPGAWPAVLALAVHNTGILGKLSAEVIENLEPGPLKAMRAAGATRAQIGVAAIFPASLGRFLLYFFYRWETCVREATVLGLLGIVSLGYWIQDARARTHYDVMFLFILLGVVLILVGDFVSAIARSAIRRAR